jgi:outer membrane receptor protein involved in Fe transport
MTRSFRLFGASLVASLLVMIAGSLPAQTSNGAAATGRVVGRIVDASSGEGLAGVGLQIIGTTVGAQSGLDGRFSISGVPAGVVSLQARRIGFTPKTVTGVQVPGGGVVEQDISLGAAAVTLTATVVTASAERGTVNAALDAQRTSVNVVNAVTREQISRSPDSDAAQAVQRVSGVTVQDGKYVFVRGLGERYTTTSLNGARIPSPEPERKVVPLDLFPSALIQSVTTSKTFTPDQPADFSGAQVNIQTREFPARRQTQFSSSFGYNDAATARQIVAPIPLGRDWLGFAGVARRIPGPVVSAGSFEPEPSQSDVNAMVSSFRNAWTPRLQDGEPNRSLGISTGGNTALLGVRTGYIGSLSYSYNQEVRENEVRAYAEPTDGTTEIDRFEGSTGRASVLWGGLLNASLMFGDNTRLSFNNTYNHSADSEARSEAGFDNNLGTRLLIDRLRFVERTVRSNQVVADRQFGARGRLNLAFTSSAVSRDEPDRSEFVRADPGDGQAPFWLEHPQSAVRTYGSLTESSYNSSMDYSLQLGAPERQHELKVGGLYRFTERDSDNRVYSIQGRSLSLDSRRLSAEEIFDGRFSRGSDSYFRIAPLSQGGSYTAQEEVGSGYGMFDWAVGQRLHVISGARVERSEVLVRAAPTVGSPVRANPTYTDVLPSLTVNFRATDRHVLRLSTSQTLSRPEYREQAEVGYRDVIGGENIIGNSKLRRTLIQNADLRWEFYPGPGEVFSLGVFGKRFDDPIERIYLATSGTRVTTFVNADAATNFGAELEVRAGLDRIAGFLSPFTLFSNLTVMRSSVQLSASEQGSQEERAMVGQAPYVVNAGLSYAPAGSSVSATVLFNRVGRRVYSASVLPLPLTYEEARSGLDVSLRTPLFGGIAARFDAKNLLDSEYLLRQGTVTRESYRAGRVYSVGLSVQR